jgi:hypothetical protein
MFFGRATWPAYRYRLGCGTSPDWLPASRKCPPELGSRSACRGILARGRQDVVDGGSAPSQQVCASKSFCRSTTPRFELKILGFSLVLGCLLSSPIALYAQTSTAEGTLTENPVFQQNCAKCHGKTAAGRHFAGPSLVSENTTAVSADELRNIISSGKHRMPKFAGKLTPEEIDTLVEQIKSLNKK